MSGCVCQRWLPQLEALTAACFRPRVPCQREQCSVGCRSLSRSLQLASGHEFLSRESSATHWEVASIHGSRRVRLGTEREVARPAGCGPKGAGCGHWTLQCHRGLPLRRRRTFNTLGPTLRSLQGPMPSAVSEPCQSRVSAVSEPCQSRVRAVSEPCQIPVITASYLPCSNTFVQDRGNGILQVRGVQLHLRPPV